MIAYSFQMNRTIYFRLYPHTRVDECLTSYMCVHAGLYEESPGLATQAGYLSDRFLSFFIGPSESSSETDKVYNTWFKMSRQLLVAAVLLQYCGRDWTIHIFADVCSVRSWKWKANYQGIQILRGHCAILSDGSPTLYCSHRGSPLVTRQEGLYRRYKKEDQV